MGHRIGMGSLKIILIDGVGGDLGFSGCLWGASIAFCAAKIPALVSCMCAA